MLAPQGLGKHRTVSAIPIINFILFRSCWVICRASVQGTGAQTIDACATGNEQGAQPVGMFEVVLTRRKRFGWRWQVCDQSGKIFADGFERTRPSAKYHGERALFFLLSQAYLNNRSAAASED